MAKYSILITGEVGRGKSRLLAALVDAVASLGVSVTVVDLAPERMGVGAKLRRYLREGVRYLTDDFRAPRLEAASPGEEAALAEENAGRAAALFRRYLEDPTPVLAVNDLTIYFHRGDPALFWEVFHAARLFMASAYEGVSLRDRGSGITERERRLLEEVKAVSHVVAL